MSAAHKAFVLAWACGVGGLATGELGAGGSLAGPLFIVGAALLACSGLLMLAGRGGDYRGRPLTPFLGSIVLFIAVCWGVSGVVVTANGW